MKKALSIILALFCLLSAFSLSVFAQGNDKITVTFHNDLQGVTYQSPDKLITVDAAQLDMDSLNVQVNDYVGNVYLDEMLPGRTYYIQYGFHPAKGFELPEELADEDLLITCEPGCSVYWYGITHGAQNVRGVAFHTKVTVPGNLWQRIIGWVVDHVNKLLAWSPY